MNFSQFLSVLRARWKISALVFALTVVTAVVLSLVLPKRYEAEASVVVDVKPDPITGAMLGGGLNPAIIATEVDIIQSDRVARRVVRNLKLDQSPTVKEQWQEDTKGQGTVEDWLAGVIEKHLDVKPSRESNVITITYTAPDPQFAAGLANAFAQAYLDTAHDLRVEPAKQYNGFFDQRAKAARSDLDAAQAKLRQFQQDNGIVGSDERLDVESQRLDELSSQLVVAQGLAAESSSRRSQAATNGDRLTESLNNPVLVNLQVDLGHAEANLKELSTRLGDNNPQVVQARANIAELRARYATESKRVVGSAGVNASIDTGRVAEIRAELEAQRARVLKLKGSRDAMTTMQRDVDNAQKSYQAIMARLDQTSLESQTQQSNVSILSPAAAPLRPPGPKLVLNTLVAIVLGGLLALGAAFSLEMLDRRVRAPQDLVQALGIPILGVMPRPVLLGGPTQMARRLISSAPSDGKK